MAKPTESMRVQVRRRMPAPRDVVYAAWTNPDGLRHWMCPGDVITAEATLDLRVGKEFRIVMKTDRRVCAHRHLPGRRSAREARFHLDRPQPSAHARHRRVL
jgi:uncharacterized protein YndB with AHSA1/START domain